MKKVTLNTSLYPTKRKILDMGLQAGRKMLNYQSQTYFNRQVNKTVQYEPKDFLEHTKQEALQEEEQEGPSITDKLNKFIDKVAPQIEEALQSNELINVFQDDFEMLGEKDASGQSKSGIGGVGGPRAFQENDFCNKKVVSCIKFHPTKPFLVAMSMLEDLGFEERADKQKTSYKAYVLIVNFSDANIL